jgi:hypothetical protein
MVCDMKPKAAIHQILYWINMCWLLGCIENQAVHLSIDFRACIDLDGACRSKILEETRDLPLAGCLILKTDHEKKFAFQFQNERFQWLTKPLLNLDDLNRSTMDAKLIFFNANQSQQAGRCDTELVSLDMTCGIEKACIFSLAQQDISLLTTEIVIDFKGQHQRCDISGPSQWMDLCQHQQMMSEMSLQSDYLLQDHTLLDHQAHFPEMLVDAQQAKDQIIDQRVDQSCLDRLDPCNGIDDDCDGIIDENVGLETIKSCGQGACYQEVRLNCIAGVLEGEACQPRLDLKADELCNGIDDDCDGEIDNGFDLSQSIEHCGACHRSCMDPMGHQRFICVQGECLFSGCAANYYSLASEQSCEIFCDAMPESCDGIDNDCDFKIDEGLTLLSERYDRGVCAGVSQRCDMGAWREPNEDELRQIIGYGSELCNQLDDNCDGVIDNYPSCAPCSQNGRTPEHCPGGINGIGLDWILVEGGPYKMISVTSFLMFKTEVTIQMYKNCVNAGACVTDPLNTCALMGEALNPQPMVCVDLNHINQYLAWSGTALPIELEWEYASINRDPTYLYPWGTNQDNLTYRWANLATGMIALPCSYPQGNSITGQICDLIGNVWELVQSADPLVYVRKGGSYNNDITVVSVNEFRTDLTPNAARGFRIILRNGF